ncbi:hypothetical protein JCM10450v2_007291 [Rhodotorula kratochvilovae]
MPSWVALLGSGLVSLVVGVFGFPLLALQGLLAGAGSGVGVAVVQFLRAPFARVAALLTLLAVAVQTGVLLEEYGADRLGTWLNGLSSSSSSAARAPPTAAQLAHLTHLSTTSYPSTLSTLLDKALALPVPAADSGIEFTAADVREWEDGSAAFRAEFERIAGEVAEAWLDVLEYAPPALNASSAATTPTGGPADTLLFLSLASAELAAVQAGAPTRAVYAQEEYTPAQWAADDARRGAKAAREAARRDAQFKEWLGAIVDGAVSSRDGDGGDAGEEEEKKEEAGRVTREMLDLPMNPADPAGGTWRDALRASWEAMYAPEKGGVMGEVERSLRGLMGDDEDDEEEGEGEGAAQVGVWVPAPLPLMANHYVRAQLSAAEASARRAAGVDLFAFDAKEEDSILPAFLAGLAPDALNLIQRTVSIDQRARAWASALLALVGAAPPGSRGPSSTLDARARAALLRASPLPRFLRATEALFALPRTHMRIGVSAHEVAQGVFSLEERAVELPAWKRREGGEARVGGCSAVRLEKERRRLGVRREGAAGAAQTREQGGVTAPAQGTARDEL